MGNREDIVGEAGNTYSIAQLAALSGCNVEATIAAAEKGTTMSDKARFEGFEQRKQQMLQQNEEQYGSEIREKYGEEAVAASNQRFAGLSEQQFAQMEELTQCLNDALAAAYDCGNGDPLGPSAREVCELHKQWLCIFWPTYTPEAHRGVTQMYVDDPRFTAYYDKIAPGCVTFLRDAVHAWLQDK
jgi:hypothetical protein